jgi:hypothetical protein
MFVETWSFYASIRAGRVIPRWCHFEPTVSDSQRSSISAYDSSAWPSSQPVVFLIKASCNLRKISYFTYLFLRSFPRRSLSLAMKLFAVFHSLLAFALLSSHVTALPAELRDLSSRDIPDDAARLAFDSSTGTIHAFGKSGEDLGSFVPEKSNSRVEKRAGTCSPLNVDDVQKSQSIFVFQVIARFTHVLI